MDGDIRVVIVILVVQIRVLKVIKRELRENELCFHSKGYFLYQGNVVPLQENF